MPLKVMTVFGTRPEAIKMAPVAKALLAEPDAFTQTICVTGQHREMLDQVMQAFGLTADIDLAVMRPNQSLAALTARLLTGLDEVLESIAPDIVLVHGDTTTTAAASLAAYYRRIPVGHVEAGLRTHNKWAPWPEEINRRIAGAITDLHFAPTEKAQQNLLAEGVPADTIEVTGNTVIDALLDMAGRVDADAALKARCDDVLGFLNPARRLIVVTGHRRENFGQGFENICKALSALAARFPDCEICYPVHLNPNVQEPVHRLLKGSAVADRVHLIEPLGYVEFVALLKRAYIILTDSGGVQEEAPALGVPVLVMRDTTERPEAVSAGVAKLVGTDPDKIIDEASHLMLDETHYQAMSQASNPYGDGQAAERIAARLKLFASDV